MRWGGLAFEMAKTKGCEVLGITLSKNQLDYCKKKAKELNLDNQVKFEIMDYRNVTGQFDRVASVGALNILDVNSIIFSLKKLMKF